MKKKDWKDLEKWTVKELFQYLRAPDLYEKLWKPLLELKFGDEADNVPATFLWGRINPRGRSRKGTGEILGYFDGGYHTFFEALEQKVRDLGAHIRYESVTRLSDGKNKATVTTSTSKKSYDTIIFTASNHLLCNLYPSIPEKLKKKLLSVDYQGINCMILELKKSISPYYWMNVIDPDISFIGCIEHTKLVGSERYGTHVMYIFNYLSVNDPLYTMKPEKVFDTYTRDLKKVFPDFSRKYVASWQLNRNPFATPIYSGKYSKKVPPHKISEHVYLANTSQVYPEDRNVSNGIRLAKKLVTMI